MVCPAHKEAGEEKSLRSHKYQSDFRMGNVPFLSVLLEEVTPSLASL